MYNRIKNGWITINKDKRKISNNVKLLKKWLKKDIEIKNNQRSIKWDKNSI